MQKTIGGNPHAIPKTSGSERRNPKRAPELASRMLLGPGVQVAVKANSSKAVIISQDIIEDISYTLKNKNTPEIPTKAPIIKL